MDIQNHRPDDIGHCLASCLADQGSCPFTITHFCRSVGGESSRSSFHALLTAERQNPAPGCKVHRSIPCRCYRDISPLCSPFLPATLQLLPRLVIQRRSRACSRIQFLFCSWSSCMWLSVRCNRSAKHAIHISHPQCCKYAGVMAYFQFVGSVDCLCHYQRSFQRRILLLHADCCGKSLWIRQGVSGDGHDSYWLGWWLPPGKWLVHVRP
jgi:hypothetical protein